jgi:transcriptional regulator
LFKNNNDLQDKIFKIRKIDSNNVKQFQNNALETIKNSYSIIQMYSKINKVYNN